jgi:hemerythrin
MRIEHFRWQSSYNLGLEEIDDQHRYFVRLINKLSDELAKPGRSEHLEALIAELNAYAKFHFLSEENMMVRAGYPSYHEHKSHHAHLIDLLGTKELQLQVSQGEDAKAQLIEYLIKWFLNHTNEEDRRFVEFMASREDIDRRNDAASAKSTAHPRAHWDKAESSEVP